MNFSQTCMLFSCNIVFCLIGQSQSEKVQPASLEISKQEVIDTGLAGDAKPDIFRFINVQGVSNSSFSQDGSHLCYNTKTTGVTQVWVTDIKGGAPLQVTFHEAGANVLGWSPAGEWIAYSTSKPGSERRGFYLVSPDGLKEHELIPFGKTFLMWGGWSPNGRQIAYASPERNGVDYDIYVMNVAADGSHSLPQLVYEGKGGVYVHSWRPDGKALLIRKSLGTTNELYLLDLSTKKSNRILTATENSFYGRPSWTADSKKFYVVTNHEQDLAALAVYNLVSGKLKWIKKFPVEVSEVHLSPNGKYLAWILNDNGYSSLSVLERNAGKYIIPSTPFPPGVYEIQWTKQPDVLALEISGPQTPGVVWLFDCRTTKTRQVTFSSTAGLDFRRFVIPKSVSFKSFDEEEIYGLLYLPKDIPSNEKAPVVILLHGGPLVQARPRFSDLEQYIVSRGIAILSLNYRGSTGYGKRFSQLNRKHLRINEIRDIEATHDWLKTIGNVDASRTAVMGGSHGGFLVLAAVTQFPERFRGGVEWSGVSNWVTALEQALPRQLATDSIYFGNVKNPEDRKFLTEISPITHVQNLKAPLLIIHGESDDAVRINQSDEFVTAIRKQGGVVDYIRIPNQGHNFSRWTLSNRIIACRSIVKFLDRVLEKPQ